MEFVTIDFETANSYRDSPCEIGLTFVKDRKIVDTKSWLIKPHYDEFDSFNMYLHGITPQDVKDEPEFDILWQEIYPLIKGKFLIAHNAGFDMSVLRKTLEWYNIDFPNIQYACSYIFSKRIWEGLQSYDLKSLCRLNNIKLNHHRAGSDSLATAELCLKGFDFAEITSFDDLPVKLKTTIGNLYSGGYNPCKTKRVSIKHPLTLIVGDASKMNPESIFYGKNVVFTGTLSSMVRKDAQQLIADVGGVLEKNVTRTTDFLIVGQQDYRIVGEDGMSRKQEDAVKLIEKGCQIEILSEEDFLQNL